MLASWMFSVPLDALVALPARRICKPWAVDSERQSLKNLAAVEARASDVMNDYQSCRPHHRIGRRPDPPPARHRPVALSGLSLRPDCKIVAVMVAAPIDSSRHPPTIDAPLRGPTSAQEPSAHAADRAAHVARPPSPGRRSRAALRHSPARGLFTRPPPHPDWPYNPR